MYPYHLNSYFSYFMTELFNLYTNENNLTI